MIPLHSLRPGEVAQVCHVAGQVEQVRRLQELGLRDGVHLEMVRGGTPCIVRVDGSTFCFRDVDALQVMVLPRKTA